MRLYRPLASALLVAVAVAATACGGGVSQEEYDSQASKVEQAETELANVGEQLRSIAADRDRLEAIGPAVSELVADVNTALRESDGSALYEALASGVKDLCTVEDVRTAMESQDVSVLQAEVDRVLVDLNDADRAVVHLRYTGGDVGEMSETLLAALLPLLPWPVVREGDVWRLELPFLDQVTSEVLPQLGEELPFLGGESIPCPFALASMASAFAEETIEAPAVPAPSTEREARPVPTVFGEEVPPLVPPSGAAEVGSGMSAGPGEITRSALLETDMSTDAVFAHYRPQVEQPEWELGYETQTEGLNAAFWTFSDEAGHLWSSVLLVVAAGDEHRQVYHWMLGGVPPDLQ